MTVEAELNSPATSLQLVQFELGDDLEDVLIADGAYRLDLCLTERPRHARLRFAEHWEANRFEAPGHVFLLPPGEALQFRSGTGRQRALICHLPVEAMRTWLDADIEWTARRLDASLDLTNLKVRNLLLRLGEEAVEPGFASDLIAEALAVQLSVELHRHYTGIVEEAPTEELARWRLRRIDERLMEANEPPTLSELAALCRLSVRQLSRSFRASRGVSLGAYVNEKRLERAKQLLIAGDSVKSVAYALGFSSPSSFCYAFRQALSISPGRYRQRVDRA